MQSKQIRILINGRTSSNELLMQQLGVLAHQFSAQIDFCDSTERDVELMFGLEDHTASIKSEIPTSTSQHQHQSFNTDRGDQLAAVLIQDTDFNQGNLDNTNQSEQLPFHESVHHNQILWDSIQQILLENEIDSVVFLTIPSGLNEAVVYQVSKALDLNVFILNQSPIADRFFSFQSISDCGNYDQDAEYETDDQQSIVDFSSIRRKEHKQSNYQGYNLSDVFRVIRFLLKANPLKLFHPAYILRHVKGLHDAPADISKWKDPFSKFFYCSSVSYFEFLTNHHAGKIDLNQKYVYFTLQTLKELHCELLIHQFGDQLMALEQLASLVPKDCKIFVKSAPGRDADYLTPMFFHRIKRILNVVRLPSHVEHERLIDQSEFVATVNSQKGWEALCRGKKVLIFGNPWYQHLPGAFKYRDKFEYLDIAEAEFNQSEFQHQTNCLIGQSHVGRLPARNDSESVVTETDDNAQHVAETIFNLVSGRIKPTFQSSSN